MSEEIERGRRDAVAAQSEIDVVRVKRSDLKKLTVLLENLVEMNALDLEILEPVRLARKRIINNYEDIEYVLGYLKGLT